VVSVPVSGGAWLARASMCGSSGRHVGQPAGSSDPGLRRRGRGGPGGSADEDHRWGDASPHRGGPARPAPPRSGTSPATPAPTPPGRTKPRPHQAGRPRTAPPAPARSDTAGPDPGAPAPDWSTGGPPWPGTGAAQPAASTDPAGARPCRADRPASRSTSSPPPPSRPPPGVVNHASRVIPSPASTRSSRSRSSLTCARCPYPASTAGSSPSCGASRATAAAAPPAPRRARTPATAMSPAPRQARACQPVPAHGPDQGTRHPHASA